MVIETSPPGADVYLQRSHRGKTPCTIDFKYYGKYALSLKKEGYEDVERIIDVDAPWFQLIPLDLMAELIPLNLEDAHYYTYRLLPMVEKGNEDTK